MTSKSHKLFPERTRVFVYNDEDRITSEKMSIEQKYIYESMFKGISCEQ